MITTGQQGLLVSSRMRHFSFLSILYLILLLVIYHIDVSDVGEGLRLFGQLRDEIFLLLHSALQFHYLKVAQTNWIFLVGKKGTPSMISKPRSSMHPSLKTSMVFREQQLLMKGINDNTKGKYFSFMQLQMFLFFCSEKIPLKASFVFLVIVPYIRYVNIFFCWCI